MEAKKEITTSFTVALTGDEAQQLVNEIDKLSTFLNTDDMVFKYLKDLGYPTLSRIWDELAYLGVWSD